MSHPPGVPAAGDARHCQVSTTLDTRDAAAELAASAVRARLAACAQVLGPVTSTYRWQGRVETAQEWLVVFKTAADRYQELAAHLRERHPYELPEIIATPVVAGDPGYLDWLAEQTRPL
jgi:periplasmic divalent cation tolerance protein